MGRQGRYRRHCASGQKTWVLILTLRGHLVPRNLRVSLKTRVRKNNVKCRKALLNGEGRAIFLSVGLGFTHSPMRVGHQKSTDTQPPLPLSPQLCHRRPASCVGGLGLEGPLACLGPSDLRACTTVLTPAAPSAACQRCLCTSSTREGKGHHSL